jgi:hypothetical protein
VTDTAKTSPSGAFNPDTAPEGDEGKKRDGCHGNKKTKEYVFFNLKEARNERSQNLQRTRETIR